MKEYIEAIGKLAEKKFFAAVHKWKMIHHQEESGEVVIEFVQEDCPEDMIYSPKWKDRRTVMLNSIYLDIIRLLECRGSRICQAKSVWELQAPTNCRFGHLTKFIIGDIAGKLQIIAKFE